MPRNTTVTGNAGEWVELTDSAADVVALQNQGAARAQDAFVVYDPDAPESAQPSHILAVIAPDARWAVEIAGVTRFVSA